MTKKSLIIILLVLLGEVAGGLYFILAGGAAKQSSSNNANQVNNNQTLTQPAAELPQIQEEVSLIAVGDLMLSRDVARKIKTKKDINYPFLLVKDYLDSNF